MKQARYWTSILSGILGCLVGLTWVHVCCSEDPDIHRMVRPAWELASESLNLAILGILSIAIGCRVAVKRKVRRAISLTGVGLFLLGSAGILFGLGLVFMICLVGLVDGED